MQREGGFSVRSAFHWSLLSTYAFKGKLLCVGIFSEILERKLAPMWKGNARETLDWSIPNQIECPNRYSHKVWTHSAQNRVKSVIFFFILYGCGCGCVLPVNRYWRDRERIREHLGRRRHRHRIRGVSRVSRCMHFLWFSVLYTFRSTLILL